MPAADAAAALVRELRAREVKRQQTIRQDEEAYQQAQTRHRRLVTLALVAGALALICIGVAILASRKLRDDESADLPPPPQPGPPPDDPITTYLKAAARRRITLPGLLLDMVGHVDPQIAAGGERLLVALFMPSADDPDTRRYHRDPLIRDLVTQLNDRSGVTGVEPFTLFTAVTASPFLDTVAWLRNDVTAGCVQEFDLGPMMLDAIHVMRLHELIEERLHYGQLTWGRLHRLVQQLLGNDGERLLNGLREIEHAGPEGRQMIDRLPRSFPVLRTAVERLIPTRASAAANGDSFDEQFGPGDKIFRGSNPAAINVGRAPLGRKFRCEPMPGWSGVVAAVIHPPAGKRPWRIDWAPEDMVVQINETVFGPERHSAPLVDGDVISIGELDPDGTSPGRVGLFVHLQARVSDGDLRLTQVLSGPAAAPVWIDRIVTPAGDHFKTVIIDLAETQVLAAPPPIPDYREPDRSAVDGFLRAEAAALHTIYGDAERRAVAEAWVRLWLNIGASGGTFRPSLFQTWAASPEFKRHWMSIRDFVEREARAAGKPTVAVGAARDLATIGGTQRPYRRPRDTEWPDLATELQRVVGPHVPAFADDHDVEQFALALRRLAVNDPATYAQVAPVQLARMATAGAAGIRELREILRLAHPDLAPPMWDHFATERAKDVGALYDALRNR